jgi:LytR cell envelope-related transcriptional attenuator
VTTGAVSGEREGDDAPASPPGPPQAAKPAQDPPGVADVPDTPAGPPAPDAIEVPDEPGPGRGREVIRAPDEPGPDAVREVVEVPAGPGPDAGREEPVVATDSAGQPFVLVPPAHSAGGHPRPASRRARTFARRAGAPAHLARTGAGAGGTAAGRALAPDTDDRPPPRTRRGWRRRSPEQLRRGRQLLLAGIGAATVAGVAMAMAGLSLVRNSTLGRYEEALVPSDPGYEAYVVPTPTFAVVHRGADGALAGVVLLSLEVGDEGGSVVVVPPALLADRAPTATATLADTYRQDGAGAAVAALGGLLGTAVSEHVEVDDAHWVRLVDPVAPIEVTLDEPVGEWPAGDVRLEPDEVGPFLAALGSGETDIDRIERQQKFWAAWLDQVGEGGRDAVPGEESTGLGRFVRGIASSPARAFELPVQRDDRLSGFYLRTNDYRLPEVMAQAVPFPTSPALGGRIRIRLLNGTTDAALTADAARFLVMGGSEIVIVGNAPTFDVTETTVSYAGPEREVLAAWVAGLFGLTGTEELPGADDEVDATVVLGEDARDLIRR